MVDVTLQARTPKIAELVKACADGALPFSGPDSLCSMVAAMGYKTTSLYEMVRSIERDRPGGAGIEEKAKKRAGTDQKRQIPPESRRIGA